MTLPTLAFGMPGTTEMIIIAVIALLIFGKRLPDVARSVGKSIVEFKKGIKDVKGDIDEQSRLKPPPSAPRLDAPAQNNVASASAASPADAQPASTDPSST